MSDLLKNDMLATEADYEDIARIWRMAFSDSDDYIQNFWKMMYKPGNCVVSRVDGTVVSMLFLLECQLVIQGVPYSAYYIYAAATHPDYEGQGHMKRVLNEAIPLAKERGADFLTLVPAENWLFDFYGRFGFETKFYKRVAHFTRNELEELAKQPDLKDAFKLNVFETRQTALGLCDFLNWGENALKYAMFEHNSGTGSIAFTSDGYAMYNMGKDVAFVKEFCTLSDPEELYTMLLLEDEAERFTFNLPVGHPIRSFHEEIQRVGMSLPLTDRAKVAQKKMNNAYIGITLG